MCVPLQLRNPIGLVALRRATMYRATMPEATINEDDELPPCENQIGTGTHAVCDLDR